MTANQRAEAIVDSLRTKFALDDRMIARAIAGFAAAKASNCPWTCAGHGMPRHNKGAPHA